MSATKNFLYGFQEFVWLIEFADLSFEQRGRAIEIYRQKFGEVSPEWFDTAYELLEEDGGADWAIGKQAERLRALVA